MAATAVAMSMEERAFSVVLELACKLASSARAKGFATSPPWITTEARMKDASSAKIAVVVEALVTLTAATQRQYWEASVWVTSAGAPPQFWEAVVQPSRLVSNAKAKGFATSPAWTMTPARMKDASSAKIAVVVEALVTLTAATRGQCWEASAQTSRLVSNAKAKGFATSLAWTTTTAVMNVALSVQIAMPATAKRTCKDASMAQLAHFFFVSFFSFFTI